MSLNYTTWSTDNNYLSMAVSPNITLHDNATTGTIACWWKPIATISPYSPCALTNGTDNLSPYADTRAGFEKYGVSVASGAAGFVTYDSATYDPRDTWVPVIVEAYPNDQADLLFDDRTLYTYSFVSADKVFNELRIGKGPYPCVGKVAHVCYWAGGLTAQQKSDFLAGADPSTINSANLLYYFPLTAETGALTNQGTIGGTASVVGTVAWDDADNPTLAAAPVPTISSVTPSTITAGSNPVIAGSNFEASQGTGTVKLSPTDNVEDANAVTQTITSWGDTSITLNGVSFPAGTSQGATLYLFVTNNTGDSNAAGAVVTAYIAPTLTSPTAVSIGTTTVTPRVTTDTGNGTCYYVITPQAESEPSNTQVEAGTNAADGAPVASGSQVVSSAGVITFSEVTGLTAGTAYRISYAHSGTPS